MSDADIPELVLSDETERLARELTALTGETIGDAVTRALDERPRLSGVVRDRALTKARPARSPVS
jgi:hypothetical protein